VPPKELAQVWRGAIVQTGMMDAIERTPTPVPRMPTPPGLKIGGRDAADAGRRDGSAGTGGRPPLTPRQRRALIIASALVAALGFTIGGLTLASHIGGRSWSAVAIGFAGEIPLARAERSGGEVGGTLSDPAWLSLPRATRTAQMKAALSELPDDVDVFFVRDAAGAVRATARWYGKPRRIAVVLR
jgi:hypothetical protein